MGYDLTRPDDVRAYMRGAASKDDWNARCLDVTRANEGRGDPRWYERILRSNLYRQVAVAGGWE